ncbi:MAG: type II toxin-antitoxin system VapC family toxin [Xanthomonadaceae bacterium]|nr:type II toxin-antitoxin system VapC family toxin [Xanthomonadaceae bacterium]
MIAVDTNVILRRLLQDDPIQSARVDVLFEKKTLILVTDVVLAEVAWTLSGKRYAASRDDVVAAITSLFEEPNVQFENRDVVWAALRDYAEVPAIKTANGTRTADFADALIVRKAAATMRVLGQRNGMMYTFDRPAQQLPGTRPL